MSQNLQVVVFDVDHGFCGFVKDPTGHTMMIDCGGKEKFSPAKFIKENLIDSVSGHDGYSLTKLIVTHPHEDHISDVDSVLAYLKPAIMKRHRVDSFPVDKFDHENETLKKYKENLDEKYTSAITNIPQWAMKRTYFSHEPNVAKEIEESKMVNNSSIVSIFEYGGRKILFAGDVEEKGWLKHLEDDEFKKAVFGCDIFVTSHHGHESGFCSELFNYMGKPLLNIASIKTGDESVDPRYSKDDYVRGYNGKKLMTTRADGSIEIIISPDGTMSINSVDLGDNL